MNFCAGSLSKTSGSQPEEGGSHPTPALHKKEWWVKDIPLSIARQLVERFHYAKGGSNTRVYTHGLFHISEPENCLGVAWWIPPTKSCAEATYPTDWKKVLSLSRLVISPGVPKNACSFLLSKSVRLIDREKWACLVTYADDWQGHVGTIYKAAGWTYVGKTKPQQCYTLQGRTIAKKAGPKTRTHSEMLSLGAICIGAFSKHKFILLK